MTRVQLWLIAASTILTAVSVCLTSCQRPAPADPRPQAWYTLQPAPLTQHLGLVGRIESAALLTLAAPFEGQVLSRSVNEGQVVTAGQPLLRLDSAALEIRLREALAEQLKAQRAAYEFQDWARGPEVLRARRALRSAQLSLDDSERRLKETRELYRRGIVARMELDTLQQQTRIQRLDLTAAQAELHDTLAKGNGPQRQITEMELSNASARYQTLLDLKTRSELMAPFAGLVVPLPSSSGSRPHEPLQPGARVSQGQALLALASLEQLQVVAWVEEIDINQVQVGQAVEISGDGFNGMTLSGHVSSVANQALPSEHPGAANYEIRVALPALSDSQQQSIRLGMSARLRVQTYHNPQAMVLPADAIHEHARKAYVEYRKYPDSPVTRFEVIPGRTTETGVEVRNIDAGYVRRQFETTPSISEESDPITHQDDSQT